MGDKNPNKLKKRSSESHTTNSHNYRNHCEKEANYKRYQDLDPDAIYGIKRQYDSILDISPNLAQWEASVAK